MGAGKTAIGRKVATALGLTFIDSDQEIEDVSRMSIPELFELYGEPEFRAGEARVIARLLKDQGLVLGTGVAMQWWGSGAMVWLLWGVAVLFVASTLVRAQARP